MSDLDLSFILKVVERIVVRQLSESLAANSLLPKLQSVSSTPGAVGFVIALHDVSAAFNTFIHSLCYIFSEQVNKKLLDSLWISYGVAGLAFNWIIVDCTQMVLYRGLGVAVHQFAIWRRSGIGAWSSPVCPVQCTGLTFRSWFSRLVSMFTHTQMTQSFHGSFKSLNAADLAACYMCVICAVKGWMSSHQLRLNTDKIQFIWLSTSYFLGKCDMAQVNAIIPSTDVVNNLGFCCD